MKKSLYAVGAALAVALLATGPLAAQTTSFDMTGVGSGNVVADVYTSPYTATVGGITNVAVICDDFSDESYVPEDWTAYVTSGSTLTPTTDPLLYFPSASIYTLSSSSTASSPALNSFATNLSQIQAYTAAAVLAVDIMNSTGTAQEEYSYAMWELFDYSASSTPGASQWLSSNGLGLSTSFGYAVQSDLDSAVSYISTNAPQAMADLDAATIYSYGSTVNPGGPTCSGGPCPMSPPQEFIVVSMAEPPSPALLGMDLLGLAGLILVARRFGWLAR
jgi:hypothetical protein